MMNCPYCKITVGGKHSKCPFCQSRLAGKPEEAYFPKQMILKFQSFVYKLQLFIVWILVILALGIDYLFNMPLGPYDGFHWSLLVVMWLFAFEFGVMRLFKKGMDAARVLSIVVVLIMVMLGVTAYYFGFLQFYVSWIMPNMVMGTMIANFVFSMIDKSGNAMAYLLTNVLMGIVPYIVFYFLKKNCPVEWIVCLIVSFILFVGAIIFRGREVVYEFQRRLSV